MFYLKRILILALALCFIGILLYISFIVLIAMAFSSFALWIYLKVTGQSFDGLLNKILSRKRKSAEPRQDNDNTVIDGEYTIVKDDRNQ